jgi:hypothetical protein
MWNFVFIHKIVLLHGVQHGSICKPGLQCGMGNRDASIRLQCTMWNRDVSKWLYSSAVWNRDVSIRLCSYRVLNKGVPVKYITLCTSSTTTFITCEATCYDLNYRSSSGLLTIEITNTVHVGIPLCTH